MSFWLEVPRAGRYSLWGRALAPDGEHDSFTVAVSDAGDHVLATGAWHLSQAADWHWSRATLGGGRKPTPLDLPAGTVRLTITAREIGTRLDAIWLTTDSQARPVD